MKSIEKFSIVFTKKKNDVRSSTVAQANCRIELPLPTVVCAFEPSKTLFHWVKQQAYGQRPTNWAQVAIHDNRLGGIYKT